MDGGRILSNIYSGTFSKNNALTDLSAYGNLMSMTEVYLGYCQLSMVELFAKLLTAKVIHT